MGSLTSLGSTVFANMSNPGSSSNNGASGAPQGDGGQASLQDADNQESSSPDVGTQPQRMTKAEARKQHERLKRSATCVKSEDPFQVQYLGIARNLLDLHPMTGTSNTLPADFPSPMDVIESLSLMLPSPQSVFTDDYFNKPMYPIKVLYNIAKFYGFADVDEEYLTGICIREYEKDHKAIGMQVWICFVLGIEPSFARSVVDRFQQAYISPPALPFSVIPPVSAPAQPPAEPEQNTMLNEAAMPRATVTDDHTTITQGLRGHQPRVLSANDARRPWRSENQSDRNAGREGADTRKAYYVSQHFSARKFSGALEQSVDLWLRDYEACSDQHQLTSWQKAEYFLNILEGPARTFLLEHRVPEMSYDEIAELMRRKYDSDSRQLQIQSTLECLNFDTFMSEKSLASHSEGLAKLVEDIEQLTTQCPQGFRSDANKIRFLRKAVLHCEWALAPIRNIVSHRYEFHSFVTALHESLQLSNELKNARSDSYGTHVIDDMDTDETHYQRYGRNPRDVLKHGPTDPLRGNPSHRVQPSFGPNSGFRGPARPVHGNPKDRGELRHGRTFAEARMRGECFKCGASWTPGHRCASGAIEARMRARLSQGASPVHLVRDLVVGMESEQQETEAYIGSEGDNAALQEFDQALRMDNSHDSLVKSIVDKQDGDIVTNFLSASTSDKLPVVDFR